MAARGHGPVFYKLGKSSAIITASLKGRKAVSVVKSLVNDVLTLA